MKTNLAELLVSIPVIKTIGTTDNTVSDVTCDSRKVSEGALFVAVNGVNVDAHAFIPEVTAKGAKVIVCEVLPQEINTEVCYIVVENSSIALAHIAAWWYDFPSNQLTLVGVTGTNGKTTTATLLYETMQLLGHKAGLLSTVCNIIDKKTIPATQTTPDPLSLNKMLREMVDAGCEYAFMEVSSHSVAQKRIGGLKFAGGIFTNLTRDHLDYHQTVDNYLKAKKTFFDNLPKTAFALTNLDDKNGMVMVQNTKAKVCSYSLRNICEFKGKVLEDGFEGMLLDINNVEVNVQFIGRFNASNLLAVYGTACLLGKKSEDVLLALSILQPVSGRFDALRSPRGYSAIVDYAHTPDALVNVLNTIQEVLNGKGNVITVVGAGGNRDKGKRPIMAQEAVKQSDKVIITSDNPRFEEPQDIINDMLAGLTKEDMRKVICIVDRKEAIKTACMMAQTGDAILVAGKGHENYQDIKGIKYHFDDKEVIREIFANE